MKSTNALEQFHDVSADELQAVSGGWYAFVHYAVAVRLNAEAQEQKVMDFLSDKLSPRT
jgi:hypothetical protein